MVVFGPIGNNIEFQTLDMGGEGCHGCKTLEFKGRLDLMPKMKYMYWNESLW